MIHTFELSMILGDYVDETGKFSSAEDMYVKLIRQLRLEKRNPTCYATTRFAKQGFPMIRLYKMKIETPRYDNFGKQPFATMYFYVLCITVNPSSMFGGDPHHSTSILRFTQQFTKDVYRKIFELMPCLERAVLGCDDCVDSLLERYKQYEREWSSANFFRVHRIDFAFDILTAPQVYLALLNRGYPLYYERLHYEDNEGQQNVTDDEPEIPDYEELMEGYQSPVKYIYYKTKGININIYHKGTEIQSEKLEHNPEENYDFLRIELQIKKSKLYAILNKLKKNELDGGSEEQRRELHFLATPEVEEYLLDYYIRKMTKTGVYVPYNLAQTIVDESNHTDRAKEKMKGILHEINQRQGIAKLFELVENGTITEYGKLQTVKKYLNMIHELGINPVTIPTRADVPKADMNSTCGDDTIKTSALANLVDVIKAYGEQISDDRKFGISLSEEDLEKL